MTRYEAVKAAIEAEAGLPLAKRRTDVPCAFCTRGGNGNKSCASGWNRTKYSKFHCCFSGTLLPEEPK